MIPHRWAQEAADDIVAELAAIGFKRGVHAVNILSLIWARYDKASRCDTCSGTGQAADLDDGICLECNGSGRTVPRADEG